MEGRRYNPFIPMLYAALIAAGVILGILLQTYTGGVFGKVFRRTNKLNEVFRDVQNNYVDSIKTADLEEKSINGLLEQLDPHSVYIPEREFHAMNDPLMGSFEGIGVQFRIEKDTITVVNPVAGGPSEKVGIRAGDRIVKINDTLVAGKKITNEEVMRKLKGPKGTEVKVSIFRRGIPGMQDYTITRGVIPTYSLDISYMVTPEIGYIRLNNFSATTYEEFQNALQELIGKGMKKLILDLQGNGGGYLQAAADVANEFLPKGTLIVYTEGVHHPREYFYAREDGIFTRGSLVVLMDEYSASASEIVAGAIQDNDRGTIIGRRSFGKGLVQEQFDFRDGSALRLTIARYYTPSGRCIQRPYEPGDGTDFYSYYHRVAVDTINPDSIKWPDSLKYKTPKGKIVYGGGGIFPDVFVPAERNPKLSYYNMLINKGVIYRFAFDYTDRHRTDLTRFKTYAAYDKGFIVTDAMMNELISYASKSGIKPEAPGQKDSDERIRIMFKAYVGRNVLDNAGFYPYLNSADPVFLAAKEYLDKN